MSPEEREKHMEKISRATDAAKKVLKRGDRIRVTRCPGTKRWVIFDHWDGYWLVTKSRIDDIVAVNIDMLNGQPVNFATALIQAIWVVMDGDIPIYCAGWPGACHEHINDAINEFYVEGAEKWKVVEAELKR